MAKLGEDSRGKGDKETGMPRGQDDVPLEEAPLEDVLRTAYVHNPFEGESFRVGPMLVTFKSTAHETAGRFALVEVTIPPYFADILPHLHQECSEAIYLTQGMLAVTLGEETMVVRQGSFILIPPRTVHRLWNPAATQATFLAYYTPAGAERFFAELAAQEWPTGDSRMGALATLWATGTPFDHYLDHYSAHNLAE